MYAQQAKNRWSSVLHTAEIHSRRRLLSEEDYVHELVIPAKRAHTVSIGSSPAVQVYGRPLFNDKFQMGAGVGRVELLSCPWLARICTLHNTVIFACGREFTANSCIT